MIDESIHDSLVMFVRATGDAREASHHDGRIVRNVTGR
jgi:hypothetical protein